MALLEILQRRYATKKFDSNQSFTSEQIEQIKALLRFSPSSINSQPWHFILAETDDGKARLAKAAEGHYSANQAKILDASLVVLFCAMTDIPESHLHQVTEQEDRDGRFPNEEAKALATKLRTFYADLHREEWHDVACWTQKQVYLNIGNLLLGAGVMGIDAVPIEGVDMTVLNNEFNLSAQGLTATAVVALGFGAEDDFNAKLPKSRLPETELMTLI